MEFTEFQKSLIKEYKLGKSNKALMEEYNLSSSHLEKFLKETMEYVPGQARHKKYIDNNIINDYKNGFTIRRLSEKYQLTRKSISQQLKQKGIFQKNFSGQYHCGWKGTGKIGLGFWKIICNRAAKREIPFDITIQEAWDKFVEQNEKCSISGIDLSFNDYYNHNQTASLDRIDSSKNYTLDNIQWIHKHINTSKNRFDEQYYIDICTRIWNVYNGQTINEIRGLFVPNVIINQIRKGQTTGFNDSNYTGFKELTGTYYGHIVSTCKKTKIPFDVEIEYLWNLFLEQDRKCNLTKIDLVMAPRFCKNQQNASLDRINSDGGYEVGNVQWVHKDVNFMKSKFDQDYFLSLCSKIALHNKKKLAAI